MKKLNLLLSSLLLVFTFNVEAKSPPPGTGKADVPANIYIMLDNSGSMGWALKGASGRAEYPWDVVIDSSGNVYYTENHQQLLTECKVMIYILLGSSIRLVRRPKGVET